jgi:hypothetical protein
LRQIESDIDWEKLFPCAVCEQSVARAGLALASPILDPDETVVARKCSTVIDIYLFTDTLLDELKHRPPRAARRILLVIYGPVMAEPPMKSPWRWLAGSAAQAAPLWIRHGQGAEAAGERLSNSSFLKTLCRNALRDWAK